MVTDTADARKVDKKTALALWDQTVPPPVVRKKRVEDSEDVVDSTGGSQEDQAGVMKFTLFTKRGNKPQVNKTPLSYFPDLIRFPCQMRQLAIPAESALAVQTRSAQLQDRVEQQHLKKLVLDYEQREEAEELRGEFYATISIHRIDSFQ